MERSTAGPINALIELETMANLERFAAGGGTAIAHRLHELDREWDIERTLEVNASAFLLLTMCLGFLVSPLWYVFAAIGAAFLLQHALQGWCPPITLFRRWGVRTEREINLERTALRMLRGDFRPITEDPHEAFGVVKSTRP